MLYHIVFGVMLYYIFKLIQPLILSNNTNLI